MFSEQWCGDAILFGGGFDGMLSPLRADGVLSPLRADGVLSPLRADGVVETSLL